MRIVTIQEAGLDGFWIHRLLEANGVESYVVERIKHTNRIKGLLAAQGIAGYELLRRDCRERLDLLHTGDGRPLPPQLKAEIGRAFDRLALLQGQIAAVEIERAALLAADEAAAPAVRLQTLKMRIPTKASGDSGFFRASGAVR